MRRPSSIWSKFAMVTSDLLYIDCPPVALWLYAECGGALRSAVANAASRTAEQARGTDTVSRVSPRDAIRRCDGRPGGAMEGGSVATYGNREDVRSGRDGRGGGRESQRASVWAQPQPTAPNLRIRPACVSHPRALGQLAVLAQEIQISFRSACGPRPGRGGAGSRRCRSSCRRRQARRGRAWQG